MMSHGLSVVGMLVSVVRVSSRGFLADVNMNLSLNELSTDLQSAMHEVLGCGIDHGDSLHASNLGRVREIKDELKPLWQTMPTNALGRLDWRSLRYVAHRYFTQQSILIRGFEPNLPLNQSITGVADIVSQRIPGHVDTLLGGAHAQSGYTVSDGAAFIAALERLIFDAESELLSQVYNYVKMPLKSFAGKAKVKKVLEAYAVHWLAGDDQEYIDEMMNDRDQLAESIPHWDAVKDFLQGRIKDLEFTQSRSLKGDVGRTLMLGRYSFDDVHQIVGGITRTFGQFWQFQCAALKQQLVDMDEDGNGRVKLSKFYGSGIEEEWRFGESEEYLRDMGVLDESSPIQGKQVMIANYIQAPSNCIVATPHYLVCCQNECETLLSEIEHEIQAPMASVHEVLHVVGNLGSSSSVDDEPPTLSGTLIDQLTTIAESYGGTIPIHGRLFAQWLHYVFPRECPFPHTAGKYAHHLTPAAYGDNYIATEDSMKDVAAEIPVNRSEPVDEEWMSQWSKDEEFFADYTHLLSPWQEDKRTAKISLVAAIVAFSILTVIVLGASSSTSTSSTKSAVRTPIGHAV